MKRTIGIFGKAQSAIDAVEALQAEGFDKKEIKVLVKDAERSRRIESETDIDADELEELAAEGPERAWPYGDGIGIWAVPGAVGSGTQVSGGPYSAGAGGFAIASVLFGDEDRYEGVLQSLGLNDNEAKACRDALKNGAAVVVAESEGADDGSGGPDLSPGGDAEAVFRRCGAEQII
ncbi:general stress protein [Paenibacillus cisolokensis]|uniref:general stress protein n=1 Tax=Paenibacillus cisolokensis TaxID=1658519 RepID=UPI003D28FC1E